MSTTTFSYEFDNPSYQGSVSFPTGVFINGQFSAGSEGTTIDVIDPRSGKVTTSIAEGTEKDVDAAVKAAKVAYANSWGLKVPGAERGRYLNKLADLMEKHADELAVLETLDNGKTFMGAKNVDVSVAISTFRYFAGWADKNDGKTVEVNEKMLAYTCHEPIGVVGQIVPWNFPLFMVSWKLAPALATGNTCVLKPSELTPLTALRLCSLINEAGFPPGVVNVVTGYGNTVGNAIASHMEIDKLAFTGSTATGRLVMEAAAKSNLKNVTLEMGGKSPNIVLNDADLELAISWSIPGIFWNQGRVCSAGSRIYVQSGIYDKFLERFTEETQKLKLGDPFVADTYQGPQISKTQFDRIMGYIESGKQQGAKVLLGGEQHGTDGYWIQPTIFTETRPEMLIVREEIFGPVAVIVKFEDEEDAVRQANDTMYGLAAAVFTQDITRGIEFARKLQAGTLWINCMTLLHPAMPFGGYKQSGIGRECGQYALDSYTNVKAVHVNLGQMFFG